MNEFEKYYKSQVKSIPKKEINPINNDDAHFYICNEKQIDGYDQSFAMTSFSTYPIINGQKQGEPICDSIGIIRFTNATIMIVSDGCGWGIQSQKASKIALKTIGDYLFTHLSKQKTLRNVAQLLITSVSLAHDEIIDKLKEQKKGATTVLITCYVNTDKPELLVYSIGDCQCFIHYDEKRKCIPVNPKWNRAVSSTKDCGGGIGWYKENTAELKNSFIKQIDISENDIIVVTTDGFSDNFDCFKRYSLDTIISQRIIQAANAIDFVEMISTYIIGITESVRQFHQNNPKRIRDASVVGKVDHATLGAFKIEKENIEKNMINHCKPQIYDSLYSSTALGLLAQYKSASEKELRQPQIVPLNDKYSTSFSLAQRVEKHISLMTPCESTDKYKSSKKQTKSPKSSSRVSPLFSPQLPLQNCLSNQSNQNSPKRSCFSSTAVTNGNSTSIQLNQHRLSPLSPQSSRYSGLRELSPVNLQRRYSPDYRHLHSPSLTVEQINCFPPSGSPSTSHPNSSRNSPGVSSQSCFKKFFLDPDEIK